MFELTLIARLSPRRKYYHICEKMISRSFIIVMHLSSHSVIPNIASELHNVALLNFFFPLAPQPLWALAAYYQITGVKR
jgi:hypothetical protein